MRADGCNSQVRRNYASCRSRRGAGGSMAIVATLLSSFVIAMVEGRPCDSRNGDYYPGLSIDYRYANSHCYGWIEGAWQYAGLTKSKWPYYKYQLRNGDWMFIYHVSAIPMLVIVAYVRVGLPSSSQGILSRTGLTIVNERLRKHFSSSFFQKK